ncbi:MAG: hypothetical protein R2874_10950 [Desulfobacterales bacterium]
MRKGSCHHQVVNRMARKRKEVLAAGVKINGQNAGAIFDQMSPRYVLYTDAQEIVAHIQLYTRLGEKSFVMDVAHDDALKSRGHHLCKRPSRFVFQNCRRIDIEQHQHSRCSCQHLKK